MTVAIVGRIGSGKTYAAKSMVELELAANARVCVVDPTGAWWGLRLRQDGAPSIFPVIIFGGEHADVPIEPDQGERLADAVIDGRAPQSVVDVSEMTGGEQTQFLTTFFERLYTRNRAPLMLVLDEADIMAPQQPLPETRRLKGATNKIVRRGRIKGFRTIMITQRPAVLDKSVLSQIDTLIAMRLTSPQDRKAIEEWVKGNADAGQARKVLDSLASLKRGEGWFWAPHDDVLERKQFPEIVTFDSSREPEPGDHARDIAPVKRSDLDGLRAAFAPKETEKSELKNNQKYNAAGDAALRAEVHRLGQRIVEAEAEAYDRGIGDGRREAREELRAGFSAIRAQLDAMEKTGGETGATLVSSLDAEAVAAVIKREVVVRAKPPLRAAHGDGLPGAAAKLLAVLDTNPPVKRTWVQAATLAGLRARGGHFNAGRKALVDSGAVVVEGDLVSVAKASAGAPKRAGDAAALVALWANVLSGAAPKILRELFRLGGHARREDIATNLGMQPSGGHWNSAWKELRDNAIVTVSSDGARLTELFRPKR